MGIIIGVIGRAGTIDNKNIIYIDENIRRTIYNNNCIPLLIIPSQDIEYNATESSNINLLNLSEKKELMRQVNLCDGIIIPGGNRQYEYDKFIYKYALTRNIPILGICMGLQLMCNVDNEEILEHDIPIKNNSSINHCVLTGNYAHEVNIRNNTKLFNIIKKNNINVNSLHNYHIEKVNRLLVSAKSFDNYIEAVELTTHKFVIGVQWHPEKIALNDINNNKIINEFIKNAREVSNARSIKENI